MKRAKGKSPQEKKAQSYEGDRHTFAWRSDKAVRTARRKRKATANQQFRRRADVALNDLLKTGEAANEEGDVTNALISSGLIKKPLRKIQSVPLPEAIEVKRRRRQAREGRKVRKHERDAERVKKVVSFLASLHGKMTLALIEALKLLREDRAEFMKLRRLDPELGEAAEWVIYGDLASERTRKLLGADKEWAKTLGRCVKVIKRVADEGEGRGESAKKLNQCVRDIKRIERERRKEGGPAPPLWSSPGLSRTFTRY